MPKVLCFLIIASDVDFEMVFITSTPLSVYSDFLMFLRVLRSTSNSKKVFRMI